MMAIQQMVMVAQLFVLLSSHKYKYYILMLNIPFRESKRTFIIIAAVLAVISISLWINSRYVSAQFVPVAVSINHLAFGTVFPGEELEGSFEVTYLDEAGEVHYRLVQKIKPLPDVPIPQGYESTSDYCQDYPNDLTMCYLNLCPYLEKVSVEQEGDIENLALIGINDMSDVWVVNFKVPAIFGHVGQDHTGGVVDSEGEYGCDISIDIIE